MTAGAGCVRRESMSLLYALTVGEHGWWQACAEIGAPGYDPFGPDGSNLNLIIGTAVLDPVSGTASHRSYLCEIRRAPEPI